MRRDDPGSPESRPGRLLRAPGGLRAPGRRAGGRGGRGTGADPEQGGKITFDKYARDTSVEELTEMVVAEYRKALEERHRAAAS